MERVIRIVNAQKFGKNHIKHAKHHQRLEKRPQVSQIRSVVAKFKIGANEFGGKIGALVKIHGNGTVKKANVSITYSADVILKYLRFYDWR